MSRGRLPGTQPHEKPEYQKDPDTLGYSALRQAPNGMIHLVSTMNTPCLHFEFNEAWILSDSPSPSDPSYLTQPSATRVLKVETFVKTDAAGNVVNVVATDIDASNGVIHVIDGVLLPAA